MRRPEALDQPLRPVHRSWAQPLLIAGAGFLWALFPIPTFSAFVWAYLGLWLALSLAKGQRWAWAEFRWPTGLALAVIGALSGPTVLYVCEQGPALLQNAQLSDLLSVLQDRADNSGDLHIHPPVVQGDRPQAFWIQAASDVLKVQFGAQGRWQEADKIGNGLFRVVYEPREDPSGHRSGTLQVKLHDEVEVLKFTVPRVRPEKLRSAPFGAVAVSTDTDELLLFSNEKVRRLSVGDGPVAAVATSSQAIWVAHRYDPFVRRIDLPEGSIGATLSVGRDQIDIAHLQTHLAIAVQSPPAIWIREPSGGVEQIPLPAVPQRVFFGRGLNELVVASHRARRLYRLQRTENGWQTDPPLVLGRPVTAAGLSADRNTLEVVLSDYRPLDDAGPNHFVQPKRVSIDIASWTVRDVRPASESQDELRPQGFVKSPLHSPNGIVVLSDGVWLVTSAIEGAAAWYDPDSKKTRSVKSLRDAKDPQPILRRGERAFHEATRSGTSCATCHPDQDSDYAWHDIGHGLPRPTLSVLGMAGTAPYLRGASYPTLAELNHFAQTLLLGYERSVPTRAQDLQSYMLSLPPPEVGARFAPDVLPTLRKGMKAFVKAGCDSCHSGPAFTDLAQYPTALLFPERSEAVLLDTPSLIGVSSTPPYLYDGRAQDLRAVFETHDARGRHGDYAQLTSEEQDDLLGMLRSL